jgi:GH25 family lysozyme M1 (1,4-beta-N-acetylmuramidase)
MRADVIDLSHWDDVQDGFSGTVQMGVLGVINKVTEGLGNVDPSFAWRRGPATNKGLLFGAYHFIRPGDPRAQARYFLSKIGNPAGLRLALDHEDPGVSMANARAFLEECKAQIGFFPDYYSFQSFVMDRTGDMDASFWRQTRFWLAAYNTNPQWPKDIWTEPALWQFTGDGSGPAPHAVPGIAISGGVDINQARDRAAVAPQWATISVAPAPTPVPVPPLPAPTRPSAIINMASASQIASYSWSGRGEAPVGYVQGMALTYARVLDKLKASDTAATIMAEPNSHDATKDALSWYAGFFNSRGMPNDTGGIDCLRHVFVLLMGLGMRESSGVCTEGRDMSASNTTADTAEAGLFQQSWGTHYSTPEIEKLLTAYSDPNMDGFLDVFMHGVDKPLSPGYGSGLGYDFQQLCKTKPAFAVEAAAVGLRTVRQEWGPINRYEAEVRTAADSMFKAVEQILLQPGPSIT